MVTWICMAIAVVLWALTNGHSNEVLECVHTVSKWAALVLIVRALLWLPVVRHEKQEREHADEMNKLKNGHKDTISKMVLDHQRSEKAHKESDAGLQHKIEALELSKKEMEEQHKSELAARDAQALTAKQKEEADNKNKLAKLERDFLKNRDFKGPLK